MGRKGSVRVEAIYIRYVKQSSCEVEDVGKRLLVRALEKWRSTRQGATATHASRPPRQTQIWTLQAPNQASGDVSCTHSPCTHPLADEVKTISSMNRCITSRSLPYGQRTHQPRRRDRCCTYPAALACRCWHVYMYMHMYMYTHARTHARTQTQAARTHTHT